MGGMLRPSRLPYFGCTEVHPMHRPLCGPTNLYTLDTPLSVHTQHASLTDGRCHGNACCTFIMYMYVVIGLSTLFSFSLSFSLSLLLSLPPPRASLPSSLTVPPFSWLVVRILYKYTFKLYVFAYFRRPATQ